MKGRQVDPQLRSSERQKLVRCVFFPRKSAKILFLSSKASKCYALFKAKKTAIKNFYALTVSYLIHKLGSFLRLQDKHEMRSKDKEGKVLGGGVRVLCCLLQLHFSSCGGIVVMHRRDP